MAFMQDHRLLMDSCVAIRCASILIGHMESCTQWLITCSNMICIVFDGFISRRLLRNWTELLVEYHSILGGSIISRLDNGDFVGLIYKLLVFS